MTLYIQHDGSSADGASAAQVLRGLAQFQARVALDAVTVLTDNSAGSADAEYDVVEVAADVVAAADSGTSLAGKASTEAAMITVKDALAELFAKANEAGTKLGYTNITYNGGGAAADGTIAAITVAVTAAATGVPATAFNTFITDVNAAVYNVAAHVNKVCRAAGVAPLDLTYSDTLTTTVAAISTATGTAASPGTTKVDADAKLAALANNVATVAARLNAALAGPGIATVVVK